MAIKRTISVVFTFLGELALVLNGDSFETLFIEMFLFFIGLLFIYSALTRDPWLWDSPATKSLVTHFGIVGTRIFEFVGGTGVIVFVIFMVIRL